MIPRAMPAIAVTVVAACSAPPADVRPAVPVWLVGFHSVDR